MRVLDQSNFFTDGVARKISSVPDTFLEIPSVVRKVVSKTGLYLFFHFCTVPYQRLPSLSSVSAPRLDSAAQPDATYNRPQLLWI
jgi:hypothetical protein